MSPLGRSWVAARVLWTSALSFAAGWVSAAPVAVASASPLLPEEVCPAAALTAPADLDLAEHLRWARSEAAAASPAFLSRSCTAWAWARQAAPLVDQASAQAAVAAALVWAGRSAQAQGLLLQAFPVMEDGGAAPPALAQAAGLLAVTHFQRGQQQAAVQWSERALELARAPGSGVPPLEQLSALTNHAAMLGAVRRHADVERLIAEALPQAEAGLPATAAVYATLLRAQALSQRRQDKLDAARVSTRAEIALRERHPALPAAERAVAWQNLGSIEEALGQLGPALQAYDEAERVAQAGGPDVSRTLPAIAEGRSRLLLAQGQAAQALQAAERAVAAVSASDVASTARIARPLRHLAQAQLALGQPAAALASLRRIQVLPDAVRATIDLDTAVAVVALQVRLLLALGDPEDARRVLEPALKAWAQRPLAPLERAQLLALQAVVMQRQGDPAAAEQARQQAEALLAPAWAPDSPPRLALRVLACDGQGQDCGGVAAALPALTDLPLRAHAALALARRAAPDAALASSLEALSAAEASGQPAWRWQAHAVHARALRAAGRRDEAVFFGKLAVATLEALRDDLQALGPKADARFLSDKHVVYRELADGLLTVGRLPEALAVLRLLKRSEQRDYTERASAAAAEVTYTAAEEAWLLRWRVARARGQDGAAAAAEVAQQARQDASRRGAVATAVPPLPRPDDPRTAHVYLLAGAERLSALVVGQQGRRVLHAPVSSAELAREVAALLDAVRQRENPQAAGEALYRHLGPLIDTPARAWGVRHLVLWLDGPLRYLPLALLHDGQQHLVDRYALTVATPVAALSGGPARAPSGRPQVQAWGVTQALAGLPALPGVADELCAVLDGTVGGLPQRRCQGALPGHGELDAGFTAAAWRAAGSRAAPGGMVHIGTHFVLRPGLVSGSWLLMGDGARLPLPALRNWPLGAPRLVTLSACDTAVPGGAGNDGREVDGLAATLLGSGAGQVLASLWRIDDRATASWMQTYYKEVSRTPGDLSGALQRAQRRALRQGVPARVWAAFTLSAPAPP